MRRSIPGALVALALLTVPICDPPVAGAEGGSVRWPLDRASEVALAYGAAYPAGGGMRTHSGADIAAEPGETARSCVGGEVAFAGRVPGPDGSSVLAVTVLTLDGLRVTCLPMEELDVAAGRVVSAGEAIGSVAGEGDGSSADPHVHVGVRRGETYLDPMTVLRAPPATAGETGSEGEADAGAREGPRPGGASEQVEGGTAPATGAESVVRDAPSRPRAGAESPEPRSASVRVPTAGARRLAAADAMGGGVSPAVRAASAGAPVAHAAGPVASGTQDRFARLVIAAMTFAAAVALAWRKGRPRVAASLAVALARARSPR